jgi:hypothetical protein
MTISGSYTDYTEIPNPTVWVDNASPTLENVPITPISAVSSTSTAVSGVHAAGAHLQITQEPQQPDFSSFDLLDVPAPSYRLSVLDDLPEECANFTSPSPNAECPTSMIGYSAGYGDCASPWTMCHCITSNITIIEAVEHLARVPVGLRRNIGTVMVFPAPLQTSDSYTTGRDMHFFGVCSQRTWVHNVRRVPSYLCPSRSHQHETVSFGLRQCPLDLSSMGQRSGSRFVCAGSILTGKLE